MNRRTHATESGRQPAAAGLEKLDHGAQAVPRALTRRRFLTTVAAAGAIATSRQVGAAGAGAERATAGAVPPDGGVDRTPLNRLPQMMQHYLTPWLRRLEQQGVEEFAAVQSREALQALALEKEARIRACFGAWPDRGPLRPRTTARHERTGYRIENVIFESRPGFPVTANLYLPAVAASRSVPGVIGCCGHAVGAKTAAPYQSFAQGLVRSGFAVLLFDPIGLGERIEYFTSEGRPRRGSGGVQEHLHAGNQQLLVGENFAAWNVWDAMRAVDYLQSRPEVDSSRLGITGNSGGGTLTTWMCALEPRLTMAAPSCFITTLRRNFENELPTDAEQCPPGFLAAGLDLADCFLPFAPRDLILLGQERDFFDIRGFEAAANRLERVYGLLGASERYARNIGPGPHGFYPENRAAMYRWFLRAAGEPGDGSEPPIELEAPEVLACAPQGRVAALGARTVFSFTRERSIELARSRRALHGEELTRSVRAVLRLNESERTVPEYRILRPLFVRGYPRRTAAVYAVATEPGVEAIVYRLSEESTYSRPPRDAAPALLYVSHRSADDDLRRVAIVREQITAAEGQAVYACDVRGCGESQPNTCQKDFLDPYGPDYFYAIHGVMLDCPYPGQRTFDLLRVIDWLGDQGHPGVHLVARGWGAIPGAFAALLSPRVTRVTLIHALTSYQSVAEAEEYRWPLSSFVPGILRHLDLPDCYRALEGKALHLIEPRSGEDGVDESR